MNPITVWRFADAPKEYQDLSDSGGDEDWVVFIPAAHVQSLLEEYGPAYWIQCMDSGSKPQIIRLSDGSAVVIGAH